MIPDFIDGFLIELALIMTVGLQNAFILKQGIKREYVFIAAAVCAVSETILVTIGIAGFGAIVSSVPILLRAITLAGVVFLLFYGFKSLYDAFCSSSKLDVKDVEKINVKLRSVRAVVASAFGFSLLNPHVLLDTTLMGVLAMKFAPHQWVFGAGVIFAAFFWFSLIAILSKSLAPILNKAKTWRVINVLIALLCFYMAYNFAFNSHSHDENERHSVAEALLSE